MFLLTVGERTKIQPNNQFSCAIVPSTLKIVDAFKSSNSPVGKLKSRSAVSHFFWVGQFLGGLPKASTHLTHYLIDNSPLCTHEK
jgi:hypothetical protein